jgi:Rrf2 family protein
MRLSKKAEYGLRALVAIARQPKRSWSIQELAAQEHIPIKFLEQILLGLRHAGVLSSKRGVGGGYTLVRPADQIRLGDVIAVFDGPLAPVPCSVEKPTEPCTCPDPRVCPIRLTMIQVRKEIAEVLGERTIEDMARMAPGPTPLAFEI